MTEIRTDAGIAGWKVDGEVRLPEPNERVVLHHGTVTAWLEGYGWRVEAIGADFGEATARVLRLLLGWPS